MNPAIPEHVARLFEGTRVRETDAPASHPAGALRAATELAQAGSLTVPVRALARYILRACASDSDAPAELARWIRAHVRYWRESPGQEVLSGPISTIRSNGGDCDDLAILHASLCRAIGLRAYPCAVGDRAGWYHMVSWAPPLAPFELSIESFYGGAHKTPLHVPPAPGRRFLAYDDATGRFIRPRPRSGACPTC